MANFQFFEDGGADRPVLVLANSLCASQAMWDPQITAWSAHFRVLRFNYAGHGSHGMPVAFTDAPTMADFLLDALRRQGVERFHFAGLSLGGMLGLQLAARAPERLQRLVIANCRAHQPDAAQAMWTERIQTVRREGTQAVIEGTLARWFTQGFHTRDPQAVERTRQMMRGVSANGYQAAAALVRDFDARALLARIAAPALVIAGAQDAAAPADHLQDVARQLGGASYLCLDPCAHLANVERSADFTAEVLGFLCRS